MNKVFLLFLFFIGYAVSESDMSSKICNAYQDGLAKEKCFKELENFSYKKEERTNKKYSKDEHIKMLIAKPYNYIGTQSKRAAYIFNVQPNQAGNVIFDSDNYHVLLESSDGYKISYVEVDFKEESPCSTQSPFNPEMLYKQLDIDTKKMSLIKTRTPSYYFSSYIDSLNKFKTTVTCVYDGGPISISFSKKY
jgi:hypothetical protein